MSVTGWKLDPTDRAELLKRIPPEWPDVIADHIILNAQARADDPLPSRLGGGAFPLPSP